MSPRRIRLMIVQFYPYSLRAMLQPLFTNALMLLMLMSTSLIFQEMDCVAWPMRFLSVRSLLILLCRWLAVFLEASSQCNLVAA